MKLITFSNITQSSPDRRPHRRSSGILLLVSGICLITGIAGRAATPLPGMPQVINPADIYSETRPGKLSPAVKGFPDLIYVPNSGSNTVDVIDPPHLQDRQSLQRRTRATACHPVLRPEDPLGVKRSRRQHYKNRSGDGQVRRDSTCQGSVQHVLHARRQVCHRRRGTQ